MMMEEATTPPAHQNMDESVHEEPEPTQGPAETEPTQQSEEPEPTEEPAETEPTQQSEEPEPTEEPAETEPTQQSEEPEVTPESNPEPEERAVEETESSPSPSSPPSAWKGKVEEVVQHAEDALVGAAVGVAGSVLNASDRVPGLRANGSAPPPVASSPSSPTTAAGPTRITELSTLPLPAVYALTVLVGLVVLLVLRRLLGGGGKRRDKTVLAGLPSSGKTALFSQLTTGTCVDSRTSLTANTGLLRLEDGRGSAATGLGTSLVDCPGHRRLRSLLYTHLAEATTVIVTVDAVTIHDDQHEGALAVSALLLNLIESPAFYGVKRLLFVATKRDELTSYSIKAVRKLLEAAMVRTIVARQGELNRVDTVVDVKGGIVTAGKNRHGAGKKAYLLDVDEHGSFSFDQLGLEEVSFVEVSNLHSTSQGSSQTMSVDPVRQFILRR